MKLTFAMIDFECNGLNPTVKSWGTANLIQISDRGNLKSIYCGKKTQQPYYTDSKEIQVFILKKSMAQKSKVKWFLNRSLY